ncbi:hypothetical protein L1077_16795 [Pseudoalteromonas luteoviolacea]|nr:hypothetical protein [Pseudoalteromonas luteoviolacea]MCF6441096.1 hypothetical protein [Pseudoalteromonas luteoviolacea]
MKLRKKNIKLLSKRELSRVKGGTADTFEPPQARFFIKTKFECAVR